MSASDLPPIPSLRHFRLSVAEGIADLVFDMDGSLVNVLSQASIADFGKAVAWIDSSSVQGVIIRSAKSLFCAGGDLDELGSAYTRIMSLPAEQRSRAAFDHFAPMNKHLLALESSGKPVVAILDGAALGGGLELVLATHHRVATARVTLGLPEVPLGLMPGAGGTQRLPRLIGVDAALPILLDGRSLTAEEALQIGLVDEIVEDDEQLTAARTYIENQSTAVQRVELAGWKNPGRDWRDLVHDRRKAVISETAANLPAPLAVLDCVLEGFERPLAEAIAIESRAFATLIQRPEPRDMVRALFVGAQDYHRRKKKGALPDGLESIGELIDAGLHKAQSELVREGVPSVLVDAVGARLGFGPPQSTSSKDEPTRSQAGYWFDDSAAGKAGAAARRLMDGAASGVAHFVQNIDPADHALIDYLAITRHGFPCWSGGPIAWVQNQHTRTVIEKEPA